MPWLSHHRFRHGLLVGSLLFFLAAPLFAETLLLDPDQVFDQAATAYDEADYERAIELYGQLLAAGYEDETVLFNLGNAFYRSGDFGEAILHFRRAWHRAPRDPDILANLRQAQSEAKVVAVERSLLQSIFLQLGPGEWAGLTFLLIWTGSLLFIGSLLLRERKVLFRKATAAIAALLLVSLMGLWQWHGFDTQREAVVQTANQQAKYGPLAGAKPHFDVPPGTIVRVLERSHGWLRISLNSKSGWIPASVCAMVTE